MTNWNDILKQDKLGIPKDIAKAILMRLLKEENFEGMKQLLNEREIGH